MQRKISRYFLFGSTVILFLSVQATAQFTIKIPKINRPKVVKPAETTTSTQPTIQSPTINNSPVNNSSKTQPKPNNSADEKQEQERRQAFRQEISDYYFNLDRLAWLYDELFKSNGSSMPYNDEEWTKALKDLASIDNICRTKYVGIKDSPDSNSMPRRLDLKPTVICAIAAEGGKLKKRYEADNVLRDFRSQIDSLVLSDVREAKSEPWGLVSEKVQKMVFEREDFKNKLKAFWEPKFAAVGTSMPADWFDEVNAQLDDFKKHIDDTYQKRKWEQPSYQDAAAQNLVKQKIAAEMKGTQILKIGTSYNGWREHESLSEVSRMGDTRYLKKYRTRYKRGWVLVKHPNRPYCQMREWLIKQEAAGGGAYGAIQYNGLGAGIFMPCEQ